ncbi:MAG: kelch repeat-containing protein [Chitinophagaceae bacterium]
MRKANAYLLGIAMIGTSVLLTESCSKSSTTELLGNWTSAADFGGDDRGEAVSFIIGDYAYIATGGTNKTKFNDLWRFSLTTKYWQSMTSMPAAAGSRISAVAFSIGSKGYVGTGNDGVNYLKDFWEYDPSTGSGTWTQKTDMPAVNGKDGRQEASAFTLNNLGYVTCGYNGSSMLDLWQFNPAGSGSWTQKASLSGSKRYSAQSFVLNSKAYIVSGNNSGTVLQDMWRYDDVNNEWKEMRKIYNFSDDSYDDDYTSIPRYNGVAFVQGGKGYLTTGTNGSNLSTTWEYNDTDDTWKQKTAFEGTQRASAVAFVLSDRGFVITGLSGATAMSTCMEWHPNDEQVDND